ncbi:hypothetical protein PanWU01x14_139770 [Parasponia andersonii]|uniref:Uncharacterized protein n=1 Tax=Parasponia andersonii TaxID=3476 RepID=A0A2P5CMJ9_PARAD|nr:hypothetical protein PanWU01x14_139770 [Parasponia andersonii]
MQETHQNVGKYTTNQENKRERERVKETKPRRRERVREPRERAASVGATGQRGLERESFRERDDDDDDDDDGDGGGGGEREEAGPTVFRGRDRGKACLWALRG